MAKCDACGVYDNDLHEFHEDETIYELCNGCASEYDDDVGIAGVRRANRQKSRSSYSDDEDIY